ncbi:kinase-like domain-containing protein [Mycena amicta]|nr:kinase-like domain-containing protein [Mycena amicta]
MPPISESPESDSSSPNTPTFLPKHANFNPIYRGPKEVSADTAREYRALLNDIDPALAQLQRISDSSYASVYRAHHRGLDAVVAVKVVRCLDPQDPNTYFSSKDTKPPKDFTILLSLRHPHILQVLHVHRSNVTPTTNVISEFFPNALTLREYIQQAADVPEAIPERTIRDIACQVAEALVFIHARGIVHRNLKPEHILLANTRHPVIKLSGFGHATELAIQFRDNGSGTPVKIPSGVITWSDCTYTAPEVLARGGPGYDYCADAWSLGAILFELFLLAHPYDPAPYSRYYPEVHAPEFFWGDLRSLSVAKDAVDLLKSLLQPEPSLRRSLRDVLKRHAWLGRGKK